MAEIVQCNHEAVPGVASRFSDYADQNRAQLKKVQQQLEKLKAGDWKGPNANTFFDTMENQLMPGYQRLCMALDRSAEVVQEVSKMIREAEEESKGYFPT